MDLNALASLYKCQVCGKLPKSRAADKEGKEDHLVAAEDGHFYHESCIEREFECAGAGRIFSPATNKTMGATLIHPKTIQCFLETLTRNEMVDRGLLEDSREKEFDLVKETKEKAVGGSFEHMTLLGRWHLLNEAEGMQGNATEGYDWCKKAADGGDCNGMAYQAIWLIHGSDEIEKNWNEGFELLVEAANEGSAYKLGSYYFAGGHGFKADRKRALRWLRKATEQKSLLSETERGNLENYLSIISKNANVESNDVNVSGAASILSAVPETKVPEHIAVLNNNDNDSSITPGSGTNSTSLSS